MSAVKFNLFLLFYNANYSIRDQHPLGRVGPNCIKVDLTKAYEMVSSYVYYRVFHSGMSFLNDLK